MNHPSVLWALDPSRGIRLLAESGWYGLVIVGAVALAVTGAEALYADLANFGKGPILLAWYAVAFPALLLNYLGQAAYVEVHPEAVSNPALFFLLSPGFLRGPLVLLATVSTVIASQALISAVFTLSRQAKSLDLFPPFVTRHTNSKIREQIYIPTVNFMLAAACVLLVAIFRSGSSLANAYGVAVTGAMAVTSVLWGAVMFSRPGASRWKISVILVLLLTLDLSLFVSCVTKFLAGGYMPFGFAVAIMLLMFIWNRGRQLINKSMKGSLSPVELGKQLAARPGPRVPGTRVYITRERTPEHAIHSIQQFERRTGSASETLVILMLPATWSDPHKVDGVPQITRHEGGLWEITAPHGYMVDADAPLSLEAASKASKGEFTYDPSKIFYIFPKEFLDPEGRGLMPVWQRKIFAFLVRNVVLPDSLKIPAENLIVYFAYIKS
jgi:KUP system potassium uptake protein